MLRLPDRTDRMALVADVLTIEGLIDVGIKARGSGSCTVVSREYSRRQQRHPRCTAVQHVARQSLCIAHPLCFGCNDDVVWCGVVWCGVSEGEQSSPSPTTVGG